MSKITRTKDIEDSGSPFIILLTKISQRISQKTQVCVIHSWKLRLLKINYYTLGNFFFTNEKSEKDLLPLGLQGYYQ